MSSYNIAGLISQISEEVPTQIAKNAVVNNPTLIWGPRQEEHPRLSAYTLYFQKLESLAYIFVAACMGLSSLKFVQWAPKDASFPQQSAFWPFKVVQGHPRSIDDFGTNRKRVYDFLLVDHCDYGPILYRFWDTATYWLKIA